MALEDGGSTETATEHTVVGKIVVDGVKQWCNVRSGPGLEYTILGRAKKNEVFVVYGVDEGWYRVGFNGTTGFIFGDLASEVLQGNV